MRSWLRRVETLPPLQNGPTQTSRKFADMLSTILLVFAFVLFFIAAFFGPSLPPRFNLIAAGLCCWVASELFRGGIHIG